jgi:hypothetical protein
LEDGGDVFSVMANFGHVASFVGACDYSGSEDTCDNHLSIIHIPDMKMDDAVLCGDHVPWEWEGLLGCCFPST